MAIIRNCAKFAKREFHEKFTNENQICKRKGLKENFALKLDFCLKEKTCFQDLQLKK